MKLDDLLRQSDGEVVDSVEPKATRTRTNDLEMILNVVRKINTTLVLSDVLNLVVDEAIRTTKADRGFIMLADDSHHLAFVVGRDAAGKPIHAESFQVSSTVLDDVFTTGESLCIENALHDERFERRQSILNLELQTIICSPLRTPEETIGVIYVDSKCIQAIDKEDILYLFEILAGQAAIAIKNARLYDNLKTTYEDLKHANDQIIKSERMALKGEIAGQVSHELMNLVAIVLLQLQVIRRRLGKVSMEEIAQMVEKTLTGALRIQGFSKNLITRARASAELLPTRPNQVLQDFFDFIKVLPKFKHNRLRLVLDESVPELAMDVDQIHQVLLNLMNNAVEAFPEAAIELRTDYDVIENVVHVTVQDNGPGIDEQIMEKLLKERVTTKVDGHGYGLPICKQIIEYHGGNLQIQSKKNEGAKFLITLPVTPEIRTQLD